MASEENGSGSGLRLVIVFVIGLVIVLALSGGSERGGLFGSFGTTTPERSVGETGRLQRESVRSSSSPRTPSQSEVRSELRSAYRELDRLREDVRLAKIWGVRSPFEDRVTLRASNVRSTDEDTEHLTLQASSRNTGPVDISGWLIESYLTGDGATIPYGSRLAFRGRANQTAPILLYPGERAIVSTGESPLGVSFHENLCTGYLGQLEDFYPSLSRSCPRPIDEMARFANIPLTSDSCYEFVARLPRCEVIDDDRAEDFRPRLSSACRLFILDDLTYNGCVDNHRFEPDFERGSWRIYLEQHEELWRPEREIIRLTDQSGRTVDVVEY